MANLKSTKLTSADNIKIASGTTAQRPVSAENGMLRYNTDKASVESFEKGGWKPNNLVPGLNAKSYYVATWQAANGHPLNKTEMDDLFDSNTPISQITYAREVNWDSSLRVEAGGQTYPIPPYLSVTNAAWQVEGYIYAPESGTYIIGCDGDDAVDVIIDGQLTANWYDGHGFDTAWENGTHPSTATHYTATINLIAGNYYTFKARIESAGGGFGLQVGWQKPSDSSITLIPAGYFYRTI